MDEYSRTSVPNIFAIGDVTNRCLSLSFLCTAYMINCVIHNITCWGNSRHTPQQHLQNLALGTGWR